MALGALMPIYAQEARRGGRHRADQVVDHHRRLRPRDCCGVRRARPGPWPGPGGRGHLAQPGAAGDIRGALILGLVLIESLVIYVLLISLILFFVKPFGG